MSQFANLIDGLAADVVALAEAVSLASPVDRALLRSARLEHVPDGDAGTEADLWFSPLVERRSADGFAMFPEAAELLRHRLFERDRAAFEDCWTRTRSLHAHASPAVQVEEELAYLATRGDAESLARIETLLHSVIAAMVRGERRGLAHWAARALPTLPSRVRDSENARMLEVGARVRLRGDAGTLGADDGPLPDWLGWVAPADFARVDVRVRLATDAIELDATGGTDGHLLRLPRTEPLLVEVLWDERDADTGEWRARAQSVPFAFGEHRRIHVSTSSVRLRNVLGEVYDLRSIATPAGMLRRQRIDFAAERARHRPFFGRAGTIDAIEAAVKEGGAWVQVVGPPGAGRSALLAHMVDRLEERGVLAPHHFFASRRPLPEDAIAASRSIVAQIAARHPDLAAGSLSEPNLHDVLGGYSERVFERTAAPLVIVVDGGIPQFPGREERSELFLDLLTEQVPPGITLITSALDVDGDDPVPLRTRVPLPRAERELVEYWRHHGSAHGLSADRIERAARASEGSFGVAEVLLAWLRSDPDGAAQFLEADRPEAALPMIVGATLRGERGPVVNAELSPIDRSLIGNFLGALAVAWGALGREDLHLLLGDDPPELAPASQALLADADDRRDAQADLTASAGLRTMYALRNEAVKAAVRDRLAQAAAADTVTRLEVGGDALREVRRRLAEASCPWLPGSSPPDGMITRYGLRHGVRHWIEAGEVERARTVAMSADYLALKSREVGADAARLDLLLVKQPLTELEQQASSRREPVSDPLLRNILDLEHTLTSRSSRPRVFISYASQDREVADDYSQRLREGEVADVFPDTANLRAGDAGQDRLLEWIRTADQFVLVWSAAAASSKWVEREWTEALRVAGERGADFIRPISLDRTPPPAELRHLHFQLAELVRPVQKRDDSADLDTLLDVLEHELPRARLFPAELPALLYNRLIRNGESRERVAALLSTSASPALRLWAVNGGERAPSTQGEALAVRGHAGPVHGWIALEPAGWILSWSADGTLKLWDLGAADDAGGGLLATAPAHVGGVTGCVPFAGGHGVLSGGADGVVRIWDVADGLSGPHGVVRTGDVVDALALRKTHAGAHGPVRGVTGIDDGRAACWYADGVIEVWDLSAMDVLHELRAGDAAAGACVADAAAGWIATGHGDGVVRAWDLSTGALRQELRAHQAAVTSLAARAGVVASASNDQTARVWRLDSTGRFGDARVLAGHEMAVTACDLSHDAHYLATASVDGTVRVWSLSDDPDAAIVAGMRRHHGVLIGEPTAEAIRLQLGADAVGGNELEMEVKGRDVVSAAPRTVRVRTGDVRGWIADPAVLAGPDMAVTGCAFVDVDPGVRAWSLLWWSADRTARLWGDDGSSVVFEGHAETVRHAGSVPPAFARVLEREDVESLPVFVTASDDRSIGVWDRSGRRLSVLDGRGTEARVLAALNHSEAFVLYNDGAFQLTDARRGDQERNFYASSESGQPMGYATTVDDDAAVTWWGDGKLGFSDADSDGRLALIQAHEGVVLAVAAGRSSPPRMADFTVSGGSDHRAIVWGLATHEAWFTLEHDGPVAAVAIDRTGDHLVAGSWDGTVSVGDVKQRALRHVLRGHTDRVHACTFVRLDTGGRAEVVVSAGADRTLRVWDVEDARELRVLRGHTAEVAGLVSVGGGIVVSWSLDRTLRVWDVAAGAQRAALHGHTDIITHAAMLDEHILLSSALDGTVRAWDTDLGVPLGVLRGTRPFVKVCALRGGARGEPPLGVALDEAGEAWVFEYAAPATPEVREAERASVAASEGEVLSVRGRKERRPGKTARTGASRVGAAPVSRTFVVRGAVQGTGFRAWANAQFPELGVTGSAENQPDGTVIVQAEGAPAALDRLRERLEEGPPMARIDAVKEAKAAKAQPRAKTSRRSRRSPRKK